MAAIDRIKIKNFYEFRDFILWCNTYYPQFLFSFNDPFMSEEQWDKRKLTIYKNNLAASQRNIKRINLSSDFSNVEESVNYLVTKKNYTESDAQEEINDIINEACKLKSKSEYIDNLELPVAIFAFEIDTILKWRCPCRCIRTYLHNQCGVKSTYGWLYKLFWKGKRYCY